MNTFKYKLAVVGASALALVSTSCKDFLDLDVYDQYSTESVQSYERAKNLTNTLYGGYIWFEYESKFAWCVNEGLSGILFNVFDQEGAIFRMNTSDDNSVLIEGYTSLYSGVIATANQVIAKARTLQEASEAEKAEIEAEGRLFRGFAHFLATEYFGEVPLVLNTTLDIAENKTLPRVSRKTLYEAIRQDFAYAIEHLPSHKKRAEQWRVSKETAQALLAKLYLTMGSCTGPTAGCLMPFQITSEEAAGYMAQVVALTTDIIENGGYSLASHEEIFSAANRQGPSSETIFARYWRGGQYGEGSAYQSQMALSSTWSPGSGWGAGKGLTYTLYKSFDNSDARKKEMCFYVGPTYTTYSTGETTSFASGSAASEFLQSGQCVMNNIKKYVWGLDGTVTHSSGMSIERRDEIIRLSDVYMMRAEANLALEGGLDPSNVAYSSATASIVGDINTVLSAHGAPEISSIAFYEDWTQKHNTSESTSFTVTIDDGNGGGKDTTVIINHKDIAVSADYPYLFHRDVRTDLMQQRRKEFAMEGHGWLDLKRLYYRNAFVAQSYLYQIDRGVQFAKMPGIDNENDPIFATEDGYVRRNVAVALCKAVGWEHGDTEADLYVDDFCAKNNWFLPVPLTARKYLKPHVEDHYMAVVNGTYEY